METPEEKKETLTLEEQLVRVILVRYQPTDDLNEACDQKSSTELIDEMESVIEPAKTYFTWLWPMLVSNCIIPVPDLFGS